MVALSRLPPPARSAPLSAGVFGEGFEHGLDLEEMLGRPVEPRGDHLDVMAVATDPLGECTRVEEIGFFLR